VCVCVCGCVFKDVWPTSLRLPELLKRFGALWTRCCSSYQPTPELYTQIHLDSTSCTHSTKHTSLCSSSNTLRLWALFWNSCDTKWVVSWRSRNKIVPLVIHPQHGLWIDLELPDHDFWSFSIIYIFLGAFTWAGGSGANSIKYIWRAVHRDRHVQKKGKVKEKESWNKKQANEKWLNMEMADFNLQLHKFVKYSEAKPLWKRRCSWGSARAGQSV